MKLIKTIVLTTLLGLSLSACFEPYDADWGGPNRTINNTTVYRGGPVYRVLPYDHDFRYDNHGWNNRGWERHENHENHEWHEGHHDKH